MGSEPSASVRRLLRDLVDFAGDAEHTVRMGLDDYLADAPDGRILRNNGRQILLQVATVVEKLPESYKNEYPSIDWVGITRMRNHIAHHYGKVDDRLVFTALARRIPGLVEDLGLEKR